MPDIEDRIDELAESFRLLVAGLDQRDAVIQLQISMMKEQTTLLTEIKELLTAEPTTESPLVATLKHLVTLVEGQSVALARMASAWRK